MLSLTRRGLFAGALITAAAPFARASAAPAASWWAYDARLRGRLGDAGGGTFEPDFARALLRSVNFFRNDQLMSPYAWDEGLAACARAHAADMAARRYFAHEAPEGFTPFDRASLLARDLCGPIAENLAWRETPFQPSHPRQFEDLWETSPGHRKNLLHPSCTLAGYGVVKVGQRYWAAGVYGQPSIRLARPLSLRISRGDELARELANASPTIDRLSIMPPGENPTHIGAPLAGAPPSLQPGVWQLRPMQPAGGNAYDVLTGPVFFV
ncbi:MAG: CAP domain-containing protein [Parcubacteria group bacterium]